RPMVAGSLLGESVRGNFCGDDAMIQHAQQAIASYAANFHRVKSPLVKNLEDCALATAFGDEEHPLLRFAEQNIVRGHARLALGNASKVDFDPCASPRGHFST